MPALKEIRKPYKIFVLDAEEYNGLHKYIPEVKKEDLEASLGFANPKSREAYAKRTGFKDWDDETIVHEAEELLAKHSSHEDEQNIRWKKGGVAKTIVPALLSLVPVVGPILAAVSGVGMSQYAKSRHPEQLGPPGKPLDILGTAATGYFGGRALAGGASGAIKGATAAAPGFLSKAGGLISGIGKGALAGAPGLQLPKAAAPAAGPLGATFGSTIPSTAGLKGVTFGSTIPAAPAAGAAGLGSILGSQLAKATPTMSGVPGVQAGGRPVGGITPTATPGATTPAAATGGILEKVKGLATPQNILGAGSLLTSMAPKTPKFEFPSSVNDLRSKLMAGEGLSPLGQQARTELSSILSSAPQELFPTAGDAYYDAALRRTRENYASAQKEMDAAYNLAGVYGSGEHLAEKSKLMEELARTESALAAQTEQRRFELAKTEKYNAIRDALGVDRDTMDDIVGLTGLDVQAAAMMYGAQVEDVQSIREALGTLGVELMMRGTTGGGLQTGDQTGGGININLGAS